jgi:hypothetical protein
MAELACVYDAKPASRVPADVICRPGKPRSGNHGPAARGKWLAASVTEDIPAVVAGGFDEAERRQAKVAIVLDFIHVLEYLTSPT